MYIKNKCRSNNATPDASRNTAVIVCLFGSGGQHPNRKIHNISVSA